MNMSREVAAGTGTLLHSFCKRLKYTEIEFLSSASATSLAQSNLRRIVDSQESLIVVIRYRICWGVCLIFNDFEPPINDEKKVFALRNLAGQETLELRRDLRSRWIWRRETPFEKHNLGFRRHAS